MRRLILVVCLYIVSLLYTGNTFSFSQEGFCTDTLVKTVDGYKPIQDCTTENIIVDHNNQTKKIISIAKTFVKQYVQLIVNDTAIYAGCDQQYCVLPNYIWTSAQNIKQNDCLLTHTNECCKVTYTEIIKKEALLYSFTVEDHIFYIAPYDICVHNTNALILGSSSICLGYITTINPIIATIGIATALSTIAYKAYQEYIQKLPHNNQEVILPKEVIFAERSYYEQRKNSLETIKQELLCIKNDLAHIKTLCGNSVLYFTYQQHNNTPQTYNQQQLLKIVATKETQLSENQKIDLQKAREAELNALEQDIIALQCMLALHCNNVIDHVHAFINEYQKLEKQTAETRNLWNKNLKTITNQIALQSYKTELIAEFIAYHFNQKLNELKAIVNYYKNCTHKECVTKSTNIIDFLPTLEPLITEWDKKLEIEKSAVLHNLSLTAQYLNNHGIATIPIRNEIKNALEKAQKDNIAKTFAQLQNTLSNTISAGGPYKDPKKDDEPEKNERKVNTISKTEFFKTSGKDYERWRDNIYKRKPGTKGIENAEYLEWDHLHNDVEAYSKGREHIGSIDPQTLKLYKGPVYGRAVSK